MHFLTRCFGRESERESGPRNGPRASAGPAPETHAAPQRHHAEGAATQRALPNTSQLPEANCLPPGCTVGRAALGPAEQHRRSHAGPTQPYLNPSNTTRSITLALHSGVARGSTTGTGPNPLDQLLSLLTLRNTASTDRSTPHGTCLSRAPTPPSLSAVAEGESVHFRVLSQEHDEAQSGADRAAASPLPQRASLPPHQRPPLPPSPRCSTGETSGARGSLPVQTADVEYATAQRAGHGPSGPVGTPFADARAAHTVTCASPRGRSEPMPSLATAARRPSADRRGRPRRHSSTSVCGVDSGSGPLAPLGRLQPMPIEELAALVTSLAAVRGHWLGALEAAVAAAAELLGADSVSVYLLSESGSMHAPLAVAGDAGGAIRQGLPLRVAPGPSAPPTALQSLYGTGEPQRRSVWLPSRRGYARSPSDGALGRTRMHSQHLPTAAAPAGESDGAGFSSGGVGARAETAPSAPRGSRVLAGWVGPSVSGSTSVQAPVDADAVGTAAPLPPDWQAMRVRGGMTDFVAVPLRRGDTVIGALQVADACTPPVDNTGAMPPSRRCRCAGELAIVGAVIASLLVDHEVLCLMGALEAVAAARNVDGLVRALARHVGLFCRMRKHVTPGIRVALLREDAAAMALFLDDGATAASAAAAAAAAAATDDAGVGAPDFAAGAGQPAGVLSAAHSRRSVLHNAPLHSSWASFLFASASVGGSSGRPGARLLSSVSGQRAVRQAVSSLTDTEHVGPGSYPVDVCTVRGTLVRPPSLPSGVRPQLPLRADASPPRGGWRRRVAPSDGVSDGGVSGSAAEVLATANSGSVMGGVSSSVAAAPSTMGGGMEAFTDISCAEIREWFASNVSSVAMGAAAAGGGSRPGTDLFSMLPTTPSANVAAAGDNSSCIALCPAGSGDRARRASVRVADPQGRRPAPVIAQSPRAGQAVAAGAAATTPPPPLLQTPGSPSFGNIAPSSLMLMQGKGSVSGDSAGPNSFPGLSRGAANASGSTGGLYGRALATAGDDAGLPSGQVRGHAMLTRGTILAEALAEDAGMYIADVAIYMQDGRNASRDLFLAHSGRGGSAPPATNSIAVAAVRHTGVPLVGLYVTYAQPMPSSLLSALVSKVHRFGAMLGPLLHERLGNGDGELADEWRYLLSELLDPRAIQSAAEEPRSRRSSAAPYSPRKPQPAQQQPAQQQSQQPPHQSRQQQQQPTLAHAPSARHQLQQQHLRRRPSPLRDSGHLQRLASAPVSSVSVSKRGDVTQAGLYQQGTAAPSSADTCPQAESSPAADTPAPRPSALQCSGVGAAAKTVGVAGAAPVVAAACHRGKADLPSLRRCYSDGQLTADSVGINIGIAGSPVACRPVPQLSRRANRRGVKPCNTWASMALAAQPSRQVPAKDENSDIAKRCSTGVKHPDMRGGAPGGNACGAAPYADSKGATAGKAAAVAGGDGGQRESVATSPAFGSEPKGGRNVAPGIARCTQGQDAQGAPALALTLRCEAGSGSSHSTDVELSVQAWQHPTDQHRMASRGGSRVIDGSFGPSSLEPVLRRRALQPPQTRPGPLAASCLGDHTRERAAVWERDAADACNAPTAVAGPGPGANTGAARTGSGGGGVPTAQAHEGNAAVVAAAPGPSGLQLPIGMDGCAAPAVTAAVASAAGAAMTGGGAGPAARLDRQWSETLSPFQVGTWVLHPSGSGGGRRIGGGPSETTTAAAVAAAPRVGAGVGPRAAGLRRSVLSTSFQILPDTGHQDTGKVAPVMANLQDKLRTLQAEQVLKRLHAPEHPPKSESTDGKDCSTDMDDVCGLTLLEPLGSGGFGAVYRGIYDGVEVAVKVLCAPDSRGRTEAATLREAFELAVMTTLSHPHIVQVLSAFTDVIVTTRPDPSGGAPRAVVLPRSPETEEFGEPTVAIAMEFCDAGSLADALAAGRFRRKLPGGFGAMEPWLPGIYATLLEVALALRHVHAMQLVHCDLKPANVLLKSNMRDPRGFSAKLSDFGLVKMVFEDTPGGGGGASSGAGGVVGRDARTGTVTHMAPELICATEDSAIDTSADVFAFGVVMWEMYTSASVYIGVRSSDIRRGVAAGTLRPEFPPWSDARYRVLAEECLSFSPAARPTAAQLVARLRELLAASGALQDIKQRGPSGVTGGAAAGLAAHGPLGALGFGGAAPHCVGAAGCGRLSSGTAAAAGALLGVRPSAFARPSRMQPQAPQPHALWSACTPAHAVGTAVCGEQQQHATQARGRSRSFSGINNCSFPLHIL